MPTYSVYSMCVQYINAHIVCLLYVYSISIRLMGSVYLCVLNGVVSLVTWRTFLTLHTIVALSVR